MKLELSVKNQSVETSGITKDYKEAFCEYIWNGLEANATYVKVNFIKNDLIGISEVTISDNGDGIKYTTLTDTFGTFLASQKSGLSLQLKSRANKGKGRFSFFAFASNAQWKTVTNGDLGKITYTISLDNINKNECEVSEPIRTDTTTGTVVSITGIDSLAQTDVSFEELEEVLLREFSWYLYLNKYKNISIAVDGTEIDYKKYINSNLSLTETVVIDKQSFTISLIVWNERIREKFCTYYLDEKNVVCGKDTTTFNRNTVNFNHSVFVKSDYFNNQTWVSLNEISSSENGQTAIDSLENETSILRKLKKAIQDIIAKRIDEYMAGQAESAVQAMMNRNTFPRFSDDIYGQMRKRDLVQVTRELYRLDSRIFYKLKDIQEKSLLGFLDLLLNSEERENVLSIIEDIVELSPKQRANFANILKRTRLENIISTITFIENRYAVIEALRSIVFEYAEYANERNNIQKIIEQHYWLFGEHYHLVTADERMQKALEQYLYLLYGDTAPKAVLEPDEEELRRMDIFACGARKTEDGYETTIEENLIVELKAPKVILSKKVLRQIEDYMDFIRKQPQFNSQHRRWKFISVCREVDEDVKSRYVAQQSKGKKGLVTQIDNYEVYALTWDDVFKSFELSHGFLLDKLKTDKEAIAEEIKKEIGVEVSKTTINGLTATICDAS